MQRIETEIPQDIREELEAKQNVVGIGRGPKRTDEGKTGEEAVIVFVKEKVPEEDLDEQDLVPKTLTLKEEEEVKTDVIESGEFYAQEQLPRPTEQTSVTGQRRQPVGQVTEQAESPQEAIQRAQTRKDRWRPKTFPGISIGHPEITAGTLGSPPVYTQDGEVVFLTNAHVAAPANKVQKGDPVIQPGKYDGGSAPDDRIGEVLEWSELSHERENTTDSALVTIDDSMVENEILGLGDLKGWANARYDTVHYKSGRTTGVTSSELIARDVTANINYGSAFPEPLRFTGLDVFDAMSAGGDSGSLIGIEKRDGFYASDLLFAGSNRVTLGIPMNTVQEEHGTLEPVSESEYRGQQTMGQSQGAMQGGQQSMGQSQGAMRSRQMQGGQMRPSQQFGGGQQSLQQQQQQQQQFGGGQQMGAQAAGALEAPTEQMLEAQGVSSPKDHFTGTLSPGETEYWISYGWSPKYVVNFHSIPRNPNGRIRTTTDVEMKSNNTLTWHIKIENLSNVYTGFVTKYIAHW